MLKIIALITITSLLLVNCKYNKGENEDYNSSLISKRGDTTIVVYSKDPSHVLVRKLVKLNDYWYLEGDTNNTLKNLEIIQIGKSEIVSLRYEINGVKYEYSTRKKSRIEN